MKRKFFVWLISFTGTGIVLFALIYGYFTAKGGISRYIDVRNTKKDVPYSSEIPQNFIINLNLPNSERIFFYLDFQKNEILLSSSYINAAKDNGNAVPEYNIDVSYELFGDIVDRAGGISYTENGEELRITGVTAAEIIQNSPENADKIFASLIASICQKGLTKSDFLYVVENCESTDLTLIELFPLKERLAEMVENIKMPT